MDTLHRLPLQVGVCVALVIIVLAIALASGGLDAWNVLAFQNQLERGRREGAELEARLTATKRSQAVKDRIVEDLIARRLTLVRAAARFRAAHRARNGGKDLPESHLRHPGRPDGAPGSTYEERLCRNVIDCAETYAELSLRQTADQVAALRARLEGELRVI